MSSAGKKVLRRAGNPTHPRADGLLREVKIDLNKVYGYFKVSEWI